MEYQSLGLKKDQKCCLLQIIGGAYKRTTPYRLGLAMSWHILTGMAIA